MFNYTYLEAGAMRVHVRETNIAHVFHQHHIQLLFDIVDPRGALCVGLGRAAPLAKIRYIISKIFISARACVIGNKNK